MLVKKGIDKHKSYKETRVIFSLLPLTSLMFNSCDYSVQVSFIPGCHRLIPVLADYPSLSCCRFFRDCQTNILAIIPVYDLGRGSVK